MPTIHLLPSVAAIQPNLELKTRPKQLLGSLPLVIALPALTLEEHTLLDGQREIKRERGREREIGRERELFLFLKGMTGALLHL